MQVSRPARAGTDRKLAGELRLGTGRKGTRLFVAHMHPVDDTTASDSLGDAVQAVTDHAIDALHACFLEHLDDHVRDVHPNISGFGNSRFARRRVRRWLPSRCTM